MAITRSQSGLRPTESEGAKSSDRKPSTRKLPSGASSTTTRKSRAKTKAKTKTTPKSSFQSPSASPDLPIPKLPAPILPLPPPHPSALTIPDRQPHHFGLIQERLALLPSPTYALLIQAILWNQTTGRTALPVLRTLLSLFPTASALAAAPVALLAQILYPIGLYNVRAARLLKFAQAWVESPPCKERRYQRRGYPDKLCGRDVKAGVVLGVDDEREGWEVAHLPGVGPYALDSWRIFGRDGMRGVVVGEGGGGEVGDGGGSEVEDDGGIEIDRKGGETEPEWMRVVPEDKDLRAWMVWRWEREGWVYDVKTGRRRRKSEAGVEVVVQVEGDISDV